MRKRHALPRAAESFFSSANPSDSLTTSSDLETGVQSLPFQEFCAGKNSQPGKRGHKRMNWKRLILGILTALAMMAGTYLLPRGGTLRDASLVQFPMTVGVWAIFVLLFVKLK
jgi:hypothetical protein